MRSADRLSKNRSEWRKRLILRMFSRRTKKGSLGLPVKGLEDLKISNSDEMTEKLKPLEETNQNLQVPKKKYDLSEEEVDFLLKGVLKRRDAEQETRERVWKAIVRLLPETTAAEEEKYQELPE